MLFRSTESEISTPVDPDLCEKFGTIACVGCVFAQACRDRQAAMMDSNNEDQPEEQLSTLEKLLREDEDEEPGKIVWAQPTPDDTSREQPPAAEKEQSINDSSSVFEPESESKPKLEPEPEEKQPLTDTSSIGVIMANPNIPIDRRTNRVELIGLVLAL